MDKFYYILTVFVIVGATATTIPCKFTAAGKNYDLTALIPSNGSYVWQQPLNDTGHVENFWFQLSPCGDVAPFFDSCKRASPLNQVSANKTTCKALGDSTVYAWDETPFKDGVMLNLYHGDYINHVTSSQARIYFICDATQFGKFHVEHVRTCKDYNDASHPGVILGDQYHFRINSKYACPL
mmetsp:Transcript_10866/g.11946  ORF Transcript_10866/g.11946 Transcript_10866/m.11946 type:complete len:182 (-) Transcript_10866:28-573(-)